MRAIMIAMLAAAAIGFFSPSGVSAAPANGAAVGKAAACRSNDPDSALLSPPLPSPRALLHLSSRPLLQPIVPTIRTAQKTSHQLSQENQERAQQNAGSGGQAGGGHGR